jgi:NAD(P)H-nitrite reductase large subunit
MGFKYCLGFKADDTLICFSFIWTAGMVLFPVLYKTLFMQVTEKHTFDYVIIGGGIAGTTAAETIRAQDEQGSIAILNKEPYELYSRVLLPKYIEGNIPREKVFLRKIENYNRQNIDLFINDEVTIIDVPRREIRTRHGKLFFYKKLLISAGGRVKHWDIEGSQTIPVIRLQTIDDADMLLERITSAAISEIIIIGGGFITLEFLNALLPRRIAVHCFLSEQRYWEHCLDKTGSEFLETHIERNGAFVHRGETATMLRNNEEGGVVVYTNQHNAYTVGMVAVGIGLKREIEAFTGIGIEVGGGLKTNEFLETSVEDIWAAGDIAEFYHPTFQKHMLIGNWNNAFLQGRIAGHNMAVRQVRDGTKQSYENIPLYAIDVLGLHIAFIGDVFCENKNDDIENISRFQENIFYERFIIKQKKMVGAVLMNKFEDRPVIEHLIRKQVDITSYESFLKDSSAVLKDTIVI